MTKKRPTSLPREHFERIYRASADPWHFESSRYELEKYEATLAVLNSRRFQRGLEVGCSIGVLTERLASRCDNLIGLDFVASALAKARERCAGYPWVRLEAMHIPRQWPEGMFDLIVFSEILYFLSDDDLTHTASLTMQSLAPRGLVLLVNYLRQTDDPQSGNSAVELFLRATAPQLHILKQQRKLLYRIDLLAKTA
jgi:predicted TPR repeat methyltransferase